MTSEEIASLRELTHRCKGGLPPCECDLPELLGADPNAHDAPLPLLQRLLAEREALLGALRSVQWAGVPAEVGHFENPACPACEESPDDGHKPDCRLRAAIAKAESP